MAEAAAKTGASKATTAIKAPVLDLHKTGRADARPRTKADLPKALFSEPFHESLVHEAARADMAARRRGTHSTLTRGEVAMTTAKAWRQKGTGRARAGSTRAPHWTGGGLAFPPGTRSYEAKVNRKARKAALRGALSAHAQGGTIGVLDPDGFEAPSTKAALELLGSWGKDLPVLVVARPEEEALIKSFRNLDRVVVTVPAELEVQQVVWARSLLVTEPALELVQGRAQ
jgi:large subunit ribosomal protein L4